MGRPTDYRYIWRLENFCFCDLYSNERLESPTFELSTPFSCLWSLYMFPNGHGTNKDIGIYLKREEDNGPEEISVRFKISLQDSDGDLLPDTHPVEETFTKNCEWGHNQFINRSHIAAGSKFLHMDTLIVVCELAIIEKNQQNVIQSNILHEDKTNMCEAMNLMYKNNLFGDLSLKGAVKTFNVHKCILRSRLPILYERLQRSPDTVLDDDFIIEQLLLYAYTGKMDVKNLTSFDIKSMKEKYGLHHLENSLVSQSNEFSALTYFCLKTCMFSWKISTLLMEGEDIYSPFISDGQETSFLICLRRNEDDVWKINIKPSSPSNDDVYVRCNVVVKNSDGERLGSDICEHLCTYNTWWPCSISIHMEGNILIFNDRFFPVDSRFLYLDFVFTYPSGRTESSLDKITFNHTSVTNCALDDDSRQFLKDLEDLCKDPLEADFTIVAGNKEFKVHKCILSARSPVFGAMFKHDMSEKKENMIHLIKEELDQQTYEEVVDKLLLFIYCGRFEARCPELDKLLLEAIDMYMVGKYYEDV